MSKEAKYNELCNMIEKNNYAAERMVMQKQAAEQTIYQVDMLYANGQITPARYKSEYRNALKALKQAEENLQKLSIRDSKLRMKLHRFQMENNMYA